MGRALLLFAAVGILLPAAAARAQQEPVPEGIGIRLLEAPSDRADDPRARSWVVDHVVPGTSFERRFEVSNGTDEPLVVDLYAAGADIVASSFTPAAGREQNELARWITVTPPQLSIDPGEREEATLRIDVPADASSGERYAAVLAERPATPGPGGVGVAARVGIRVYLSVGPGGEPATDFAIESLTARRREDDAPVVDARVVNTGGRALDFTGELTLADGPGGLMAGPFQVTSGTTIEPESTTTVEVVLDPALPVGPWRATLVLRSGLLERVAEATITFPEEPETASAPVTAEPPRGRAQLLVLSSVLLLFALLLLAIWWWDRQRRRGEDEEEPGPGAGAPVEVTAPR